MEEPKEYILYKYDEPIMAVAQNPPEFSIDLFNADNKCYFMVLIKQNENNSFNINILYSTENDIAKIKLIIYRVCLFGLLNYYKYKPFIVTIDCQNRSYNDNSIHKDKIPFFYLTKELRKKFVDSFNYLYGSGIFSDFVILDYLTKCPTVGVQYIISEYYNDKIRSKIPSTESCTGSCMINNNFKSHQTPTICDDHECRVIGNTLLQQTLTSGVIRKIQRFEIKSLTDEIYDRFLTNFEIPIIETIPDQIYINNIPLPKKENDQLLHVIDQATAHYETLDLYESTDENFYEKMSIRPPEMFGELGGGKRKRRKTKRRKTKRRKTKRRKYEFLSLNK